MTFDSKRLFAVIALISVVAFSLVQIPVGVSEDLNNEAEALSVITDVIGLDTSKYSANLYKHKSEIWAGVVRDYVDYTLESAESEIRVMITFSNDILTRWVINPSEGKPIYASSLAPNALDLAKDTLQRYQTYSNLPIIQEASSLLDDVAEIKDIEMTRGNLKMRITGNYIDWVRTINGLEFPIGLSIKVDNGIVDTFTDESSFFRIGSSDVNISREEAASIALEEAKTFTSVEIWLGDHDEVFPFSVKEDPMVVTLEVGTNNFTMYPSWHVWFAAEDEVYSVTGVAVYMRADTGEITNSYTTSPGGFISDPDATVSPTSDPQASPDTQPEGNPNQPIASYIIAGTAATAITVAIAAVALKKKSK